MGMEVGGKVINEGEMDIEGKQMPKGDITKEVKNMSEKNNKKNQQDEQPQPTPQPDTSELTQEDYQTLLTILSSIYNMRVATPKYYDEVVQPLIIKLRELLEEVD